MNKPLKRIKRQLYYLKDGERVSGPNPQMTGDCSDLWGDCTGLRGDCTDLEGNLSLITPEMRKENPNIEYWVSDD